MARSSASPSGRNIVMDYIHTTRTRMEYSCCTINFLRIHTCVFVRDVARNTGEACGRAASASSAAPSWWCFCLRPVSVPHRFIHPCAHPRQWPPCPHKRWLQRAIKIPTAFRDLSAHIIPDAVDPGGSASYTPTTVTRSRSAIVCVPGHCSGGRLLPIRTRRRRRELPPCCPITAPQMRLRRSSAQRVSECC